MDIVGSYSPAVSEDDDASAGELEDSSAGLLSDAGSFSVSGGFSS